MNRAHHFFDSMVPIACMGILAAILLFGLWPLGYRIPNKAKLMEAGAGIHFEGENKRFKLEAGGVAYTLKSLRIDSTRNHTRGELSLEMRVKPFKAFTNGVGSIVVFCDRQKNKRLVFGQWKSHLVIRTFYFPSSRRGPYTEIGMRDLLIAGKQSIVTVTTGLRGTAVYADGKMSEYYPNVSLLPAKMSVDSLQLFIGSDPDATGPWSGEIKGLAVYDRMLSASEVQESTRLWEKPSVPFNDGRGKPIACYRFTKGDSIYIADRSGHGNSLVVPAFIELRQRPLRPFNPLEPPVGDMIINVAGFIPLGLFFFLWFGRSGWFSPAWIGGAVVVFGLLTSLGIEWTQSFLPSRSSSVMDVICNTVGTMMGVAAGYAMRKKGRVPNY